MLRKTILYAIFIAFSASAFAQTKQEADNLYSKEHYAEAAQTYEAILAKQGVAAEIYYNLGNCYYKQDNIPLAILNYERALVLSPGDGDIRSNLAFARGKTIDKVTPPSEMFFVTWWRNLTHLQSLTAWATTGIICFVLALVCLLIYFLAFSIPIRKAGFYLSMLFFFLVVLILLLTGSYIYKVFRNIKKAARQAAEQQEQRYREETGRQRSQYSQRAQKPYEANGTNETNEPHKTTTTTGETIIDHRHQERENKKIFDDSDGEYVEFEEV